MNTTRPLALHSNRNERWSLDVVSDAFIDGRSFHAPTVVYNFTRECHA